MREHSTAGIAGLITSALASLLLRSAPAAPRTSTQGPSFQVAVVGGGVPEGLPDASQSPLTPTRPSGDDVVGYDYWRGASAANEGNSTFSIVARNDHNEPTEALAIAARLRANPATLAVIGHAASGATRVANDVYASAGIPLVMPVATATSVMFPTSVPSAAFNNVSARFSNAFRLPGSDRDFQVPTIVSAIKSQFRETPGTVRVIEYVDENSKEYAQTLGEAMRQLLQREQIHTEVRPIDQNTVQNAAQDARADLKQNDALVFIGYDDPANEFFRHLSALYDAQTTAEMRPTLFFSDGALSVNRQQGAERFRLFRAGYRDVTRCATRGVSVPADQRSAEFTLGYDAVAILRQALRGCGTRISRSCLVEQISRAEAFEGSCGEWYAFHLGESVLTHYYLYRSAQDMPQAFTQQQLLDQLSR